MTGVQRKLGAVLLDVEPETSPSQGPGPQVDGDTAAEYQRLKRGISEAEETKDLIEESLEALERVKVERRRYAETLESLQRETEPALLRIGRCAIAMDEYAEALAAQRSRLEPLARDAEQLDDEIDRLRAEDEKSNILDRLGRRTKASLLASRRQRIEGEADAIIRSAGEQVFQLGGARGDEDELKSALEVYGSILARIGETRDRLAQKDEHIGTLKARLQAHDALRTPKIALSRISRRVTEDESRLQDLCEELGKRVVGQALSDASHLTPTRSGGEKKRSPKEAASGTETDHSLYLIERAASIDQSMQAAARRIEVLEAGMEIDKLHADIDALNKEIEGHRVKIREREESIRGIQEKIHSREGKIVELEAKRAPRPGDAGGSGRKALPLKPESAP